MCSHDLHIGQYTQCPSLILFTDFPLPTKHAKMSANYSHFFFFFFFLLVFWRFWRSWKSGQLSIGQRPHRRNTLQCRMETLKTDRAVWTINCWWSEHIKERRWTFILHRLPLKHDFVYGTVSTWEGEADGFAFFRSSLINRGTNFGLNVSKTL